MSKEEIVILPSSSASSKVTSGNFLFVSTGEKLEQRAPIEKDKNNFKYIFEEAAKYSITPGTFKSRTLSNQIKELGDDFTWYIDEFSHGKSSVLRYGINPSKVKVSGKIDTSSESHSSINTKKYTEDDAKKVIHEKVEIAVIQKAIEHLLNSSDRTVLIDIFARDNGILKLKDGVLETHTVVLYKNPLNEGKKHDVLVIDPSNFLFSSHIANLNGIVKHDLLDKVVTLHKNIQIYKAAKSGTVGPKPDQYRDCIDVSVKLAFGLNEEGWKNLGLTQKEVEMLSPIKMISNTKLDPSIIEENLASRVKQSSDANIVKAFYKIEQALYKNLNNLVSSGFKEAHQAIFKKCAGILHTTNMTKLSTLNNLKELNEECTKHHIQALSEALNADQHDFQGLIGLIQETEEVL